MLSDLVVVAAALGACVYVARGTRWAAAIECAFPIATIAWLTTGSLFALGVIVAAAFAAAALVDASPILLVAGVALLRWIPLREVEVWREVVVMAATLMLFVVRRSSFFVVRRPSTNDERSTLALIAALAVAAVTPVHPGKAALIPFLIAALCLLPDAAQAAIAALCAVATPFVRWSLVPILVTAAFALLVPYLGKLKVPAYATALAVFAMWPWSGLVARALPVVMRYEPPAGEVRVIGRALSRGESLAIDIPPARHVIVTASMANAAWMRAGREVGFVENRAIRIGDIADFGFTRRPHFFAARNPLPRISRGDLRDYGAVAWLHGAGAVGVASAAPMRTLHVRAADDLPPGTQLQIESIELPAR